MNPDRLARPRPPRPGQAPGLAGARSARPGRRARARRARRRASSTTKGAPIAAAALWAALAADAPAGAGARRVRARGRARWPRRPTRATSRASSRWSRRSPSWPDPWKENRRCRASWSSTIATRRWRWSTASCRSSTPSRAAIAASPARCARSASAAARCAARTTTARRPQALARLDTLPDLVVLDLHFALPEERLLPEDKSALPAEPKARKTALEGLRRRQGLLILEQLRASYPTLPVVMLTTTGSDLGAERPADPLVYLCENEVVDSRSLAAEISRALALHHSAQEGAIFWGRAPAMAELRRQLDVLARSPLPVLVEGETGHGQELPGRARHPPALGRQGAAGGDRSVDGAAGAAGGAPVRRAARRLHGRRRGSRGRVRAGARRDAVPRRDRQPGSRAAAAAAAGARARRRSRASATRARARRRPSWWRRPTRTSRRWCARGGSAPTSTCASTRRRGCACRRCASGARTCPSWSASRSSRRCARSRCARWCARTWRGSRRRRTSTRTRSVIVFGRPRAAGGAAGRLLGVRQPGGAGAPRGARLAGQPPRAALLAANALVFCLTQHLDVARRARRRRRARPPSSRSPIR